MHEISNKVMKGKDNAKGSKGGLRMDLSFFQVKQPPNKYHLSNSVYAKSAEKYLVYHQNLSESK